jgi:LPXTG-motif cell wall-anchored protein
VLFDAHQIFYEWEYRKLYCKGIDDTDTCSPIDYSNPPYQVVMEFSGTTKKSNVFHIPVPTEIPDKFDAAFELKVTDSELIVKKEGTFKNNENSKPSNPAGFDQNIIFILIAIIVVAVAVFYFVKKKKR